jgi:hypothetical protein
MKVMRERRLICGDANTVTAAAAAGLEHDREPYVAGCRQGMGEVCNFTFAARHDRHTRRPRCSASSRFVAHGTDGFRRGSDEDKTGGGHSLGEPRILGKKSIAGMDCARTGLPRGGNDRFGIKIAFRGRRGTDAHRLVGKAHGETVLIGVAEHRDGAQVEFLRRADDPHSDFAAISNQELVKHECSSAGFDHQHGLS